MVFLFCLHRGSNEQTTLHTAERESEATADYPFIAYPERFAQGLDLFRSRVQT